MTKTIGIISCALMVALTTISGVQARSVPQMQDSRLVSVHPEAVLLAKRDSVTPAIKSVKMSPEELRIRVRAIIRPTLGTIEEGADEIIAESSDPVIRRGALVLKIEMLTTMLAAMLRTDPVMALADSWGYVFQCEDALKRPETRAKYGEYATKAAEILQSLEGQFREFATGIQASAFADSVEASLRKWAENHPIKGALYRRPSMDTAEAKALAESKDGGIFSALGSLEETTADMMTRMDLYTMYLPRLARWEAELAAIDMAHETDTRKLPAEFEQVTRDAGRVAAVAEKLAAEFEQVTRDASRLAAVAETLPSLAARERATVMDIVQSERIAALREFEELAQRLAERSAPLIQNEIQTNTNELAKSIEEIRKRLLAETSERLERLVDYVFLRLVQLLLICVVVLAALGFAFRRYLLRR